MNVSHFIAKRLVSSRDGTFTRIVVRMAVAAVALSTIVMILASTMIAGFKQEITSKILGFWGHIHITDGGLSSTIEQMEPLTVNLQLTAELEDIAQVQYEAPQQILGLETGRKSIVQTEGGVRHVQAFAFLPGILSTRELFGGVILKGVDVDYDWYSMQDFIIEGEAINLQDEADNELLISSTTARTLKIEVGQRVQLSFIKGQNQVKRAFVVVGIYNTGLEEFDRQFALADLSKVQDILGWESNQIGGYEVFLDQIDDVEVMTEYIYYEVLPANVLAQSIKSKLSSIFEWLQWQDINMQVILVLMIIVAIINMTTALLILILDRSQMVGVLKAVGASNWTTRKIFLYQASYILGYGLLIGNVIGIALAVLQQQTHFIKLDEASYYLTHAPIAFDWWTILWINVSTFAVVTVCLILPTFLVAKINPVKVLSFS